jgi:hypothetical protein
MITLATAEVAGIAFFIVPMPVAALIVILGARSERADTFLLLMASVTLLPAVWATATRAGWGGCDGCLSDREEDLMTAALASLPFLAAAIVLLFTGRRTVGAGALIVAQIAVGIGVWLPNKGGSFLMLLLIAGEVAYMLLGAASRRNVETISAGNGHPPGTRVLTSDE